MAEAVAVRQHSVLSYVVGVKAASAVGYGDTFDLRRSPDCGGEALPAQVWVQTEIHATNPVNDSFAHIDLDPGVMVTTDLKVPRVYVCFRKNGASRRCLASVKLPDRKYRVRHLVASLLPLRIPSLESGILLIDAANSPGLDALETMVFLIALLFLISVAHAAARLYLLRNNVVGAPLPEIVHVREQSEPAKALRVWAGRYLEFSASVFTLTKLSLEVIGKAAPFEVVLGFILWPCTCGLVVLLGMSQRMSSQQIYWAALVNGKRMTDCHSGRVVSALLAGCVAMLVSLVMVGMIYANTRFPTELLSPVVAMVRLTLQLHDDQVDQQRSVCKISLQTLHRTLTTQHEKSCAEAPDAQSLDWVEKIKSPSRKLDIAWGSFCETYRRGLDPLECARRGVTLPEGPGFSVRDLRWHGRAIHRMTGSKAGLANIPLLLFFALVLSAFGLRWATWYLVFPPSVSSLAFTGGMSDSAFNPVKHRYSYFQDRSATSVGMYSVADESKVRSWSLALSNQSLETASEHVPFSMVDVAHQRFPAQVSLRLGGIWEATSQAYELQLVPVTSQITSIVLRAAGWSRCVQRSRGTAQSIVLLEPTPSLDVEIALKHFSPTVPTPSSAASDSPDLRTVFEPRTASGPGCPQMCYADARCLTAFEGATGCFFVRRPAEKLCEVSHNSAPWTAPGEQVYNRLLLNRTKATMARICMRSALDEEAEACHDVSADAHGHLTIRNVTFPQGQRSLQCDIELLLDVNSDEKIGLDTFTFILRHTVPIPSKFLVWGGNISGSASLREGNDVDIIIHEFNVTAINSQFEILVAPVLTDEDYTWRWIDVGLADDAWRPTGCHDDPDFAQLSVCGGKHKQSAAILQAFKWAPWIATASARMEPSDPRSGLPSVDVQIRLATDRDEFPSAWSVRQSCSLDLSTWSMGLGKLHDFVFNRAMYAEVLAKCPSLTMLVRLGQSTHTVVFTIPQLVVLAMWQFKADIIDLLGVLARSHRNSFEDVVQRLNPEAIVDSIRLRAMPGELPPLARRWFGSKFGWHRIIQLNSLPLAMPDALQVSLVLARKLCRLVPVTEASILAAVQSSASEKMAMDRVSALLECAPSLNFSLSQAEPLSVVLALFKSNWATVLSKIADAITLTTPILFIAEDDQTLLVEKSLFDLAIVYGALRCVPILLKGHVRQSVHVVSLTHMALTEAQLPVMARGLQSLQGAFVLDIGYNQLGRHGINMLGKELVERFGNGSTLLHGLKLGYNIRERCDDDVVLQYGFLEQFPYLQELDLSGSQICGAEVAALQPLLCKLPRLRALDVSANGLGGSGLQALGLEACDQLRALRLASTDLGDSGAAPLAAALHGLRALEDLDLSQNSFGELGMTRLAPALENLTQMRNFSLRGNALGPAAAASLERVLGAWAKLQVLDLGGARAGAALAKAIRAADLIHLARLDASGCRLGAAGAAELGGALAALPRMESLAMDSNELGELGPAALEHAVGKLPSLRVLRLSNNSIGASAAGVEGLGRVLARFVGLRRLDIGGNRLGASGLRAIQHALEGLGSRGLEALEIYGNDLGKEGAKVLVEILRHPGMSRLKYLDIHDNNITTKIFAVEELGMTLRALPNLETLIMHRGISISKVWLAAFAMSPIKVIRADMHEDIGFASYAPHLLVLHPQK